MATTARKRDRKCLTINRGQQLRVGGYGMPSAGVVLRFGRQTKLYLSPADFHFVSRERTRLDPADKQIPMMPH